MLAWFYSRAEYLTMGVDELLTEMGQMFDQRPGKLTLRREFESRVWRGGESFCDYCRDKMILANRIPIAKDEILDYLIDGVMDQQLRNQARLMNYRTGAELLKAFKKVQLGNSRPYDAGSRREGPRTGNSGRAEAPRPSTMGQAVRCFKCRETGHFATQCKRAPVKGACFVCESTEHLARDCPKRHRPSTSGASRDVKWAISTNVVQPIDLPKPYMIRVKITTEETNSELCHYMLDALIDSGSPISLVRNDIILGESRLLEKENVHQFCGINGSRLIISGIFHGILEVNGVRVRMKFYTVPIDTMAYDVLLGRDFLNCPQLCVTMEGTVKITGEKEARAIDQLMYIDCDGDSPHTEDELKVNPAIGESVSASIHEAYESH